MLEFVEMSSWRVIEGLLFGILMIDLFHRNFFQDKSVKSREVPPTIPPTIATTNDIDAVDANRSSEIM